MSFIVLYVTHQNEEEAEKVSKHLLDKKLIACVNSFEAKSTCFWKGELDRGEEVVTLFKTSKKLYKTVEKEIEEVHPYEIPCIIKFEVEANESYEKWIEEQTS